MRSPGRDHEQGGCQVIDRAREKGARSSARRAVSCAIRGLTLEGEAVSSFSLQWGSTRAQLSDQVTRCQLEAKDKASDTDRQRAMSLQSTNETTDICGAQRLGRASDSEGFTPWFLFWVDHVPKMEPL